MTVLCRGQGLEPHVEVERNLVEFGPILPHSPGDEQTILLRNPCPFPVEIYSLECDKSYLEEEKVSGSCNASNPHQFQYQLRHLDGHERFSGFIVFFSIHRGDSVF